MCFIWLNLDFKFSINIFNVSFLVLLRTVLPLQNSLPFRVSYKIYGLTHNYRSWLRIQETQHLMIGLARKS